MNPKMSPKSSVITPRQSKILKLIRNDDRITRAQKSSSATRLATQYNNQQNINQILLTEDNHDISQA